MLAERRRCRFSGRVTPGASPDRRARGRATQHFEFDVVDSSGSSRVVELSATGLYDSDARDRRFSGTYGVIRDVTQTRRTARELAANRAKFHGLFMNSPDAVFISRVADGRIQERNGRFGDMLERMGAGAADDDLAVFGAEPVRAQFIDELIESPARHRLEFDKTVDGETRFFERSLAVIVAVMAAPVRTAFRRLLVMRASRSCIRSPAMNFSESVSFSIP